MVVHHGPFLRHTVAGRSRVTGTAVILVHRLLKNGLGRTGGYALLTEPVVRSLGIDEAEAGLPVHTERYEHLGDVRCFVRDLDPAQNVVIQDLTPGEGRVRGRRARDVVM
jgi:hypothetical protein